jgi:hypothetical protein
MNPYRCGKDGTKTVCLDVVLCLGQIQNPDRSGESNFGSVFDVTLPGFPGVEVSQDHYGNHCIKKNSLPCNDAMEI